MNELSTKKDFPIFKDDTLIYLDTAASSLTPLRVIERMNDYYMNYPVNVHRGVYNLSYQATMHYTKARENVAAFINASFDEIVFTRGASSALNLVALSYGMTFINEGDEIIVSELEHHSHLLPWQQVAKRRGAKLVYVPLSKEGRITVEAFKKVLTKHTKFVALTYVSNTMGYITPIKEIIKLAHAVGALVSVDAAQAAPHIPIDVKAIDCDFLAFSGHKMCGPTGIGVLYGKKSYLNQMPPLEFGGDMNDYVEKYDVEVKDVPYKFETGTPPIAEAIGLSEALDYLKSIGLETIHKHENQLKNLAMDALKTIKGVTIYNESTESGIINFNFDGVHPHDVVSYFDQDHIALRAGHHCAQLVVKWLQVPATLRASFYLYNTYEDVVKFIDSVKRARKFFSEVGF